MGQKKLDLKAVKRTASVPLHALSVALKATFVLVLDHFKQKVNTTMQNDVCL